MYIYLQCFELNNLHELTEINYIKYIYSNIYVGEVFQKDISDIVYYLKQFFKKIYFNICFKIIIPFFVYF